ncbi:uncharacterized protein LOC104650374 isoform X3 [Saimiri boliviensis]|uniref:uncharacterized protein LOC104650374 isoform X3 n=1 Tax=Saimiri boliviensis TaxID=27679 RepID=UPI003D787962
MAPPTSVHQATRPPAFSSASLIPAAGSGAAEREAWLRAGGRLGGARAAVVWLRWRCRAGCRIPGRARRGSARSWTASGASAITSPTTGAGASWSSVWPHPGHAGSLQLQEHLPGLVAMPFCQLGMVRTGSDPAGVVDPGPAHKNGAEDWQCPLLCHCDIPRVTLSRTQTLTSARWDYSSLSFCSRHPPPASMTSPSPPAWSKTVVRASGSHPPTKLKSRLSERLPAPKITCVVELTWRRGVLPKVTQFRVTILSLPHGAALTPAPHGTHRAQGTGSLPALLPPAIGD